jgi:hypothetical protein
MRQLLDAARKLSEERHTSMAAILREALYVYIAAHSQDADTILASTFGVMPELDVPDRDEWDRV